MLELIFDIGLSGAKLAITPMGSNLKLTAVEYDKATSIVGDVVLKDITLYQKLIGKLMYVTITRPDISYQSQVKGIKEELLLILRLLFQNYAIQTFSQFMQQPKRSYWEAAHRVVGYLRNAPGQEVWIKAEPATELSCWCDSDWAACPNTRRLVTGYVIKFGGSLISWKSKKQQTASESSAEAEYRSMASAVAEVIWLLGLFRELELPYRFPVTVLSDSKYAMQIAANPIFHDRTKHIEIIYHFIRDKIKTDDVKTVYLHTKDQLADLLTKG